MAKRILIVEDNMFISKILSNKLKGAGFTVEKVENGALALENIEKRDYSLIVTDLMMPQHDGFELLMELRSRKNKVPVIVFTHLSQPKDEKEVMDLGAKEMISKDMPIDAIILLVKKYLN